MSHGMQIAPYALNLDDSPDEILSAVIGFPEGFSEGQRKFAEYTLAARHYRRSGNIERAMVLEGAADQVYAALDADERW
jgi:hypothetical protein